MMRRLLALFGKRDAGADMRQLTHDVAVEMLTQCLKCDEATANQILRDARVS